MSRVMTSLLFLVLASGPATGQASDSGPMPLAYAVDRLADRLLLKIPASPTGRVAVTPFLELDGRVTRLGVFFSERLTTRLIEKSVAVVERSRLDAVIEELQLARSRAFDGETAKKVGQLVGAEYLLTGSLSELATFVEVNARLVDAASGRVLAAAQVALVKDQDLASVLSKPLESDQEGGEQADIPSNARAEAHPKAQPSAFAGGLQVDFVSCRLVGTALSCQLTVTCLEKDESVTMGEFMGLRQSYSRVFVPDGQEFFASGMQLGSVSGALSKASLLAEIPSRLLLTFEGLPAKISTLAMLEVVLKTASKREGLAFKFKNISVQR